MSHDVRRDVWIATTGTANLASVKAALYRAGTEPHLATTPEQVQQAKWLILPGVGAFGAAIQCLQEAHLFQALQDRILAGRPTLAICLGLQLFASASEESPGFTGLSIVPGTVTRFPEQSPTSTGSFQRLRVPQFGWSQVHAPKHNTVFSTGYAYYANSYCLRDIPEGWDIALSEYGGSYVAAMCKGAVMACQFHPELSGAWGHSLILSWLERGESWQQDV